MAGRRAKTPFCLILLGNGGLSAPTRLIMWHGNLDAIVPSHQHTILGSPELGNAHGQPDADRQQRDRKGERGDICQHAMPKIVRRLPRSRS